MCRNNVGIIAAVLLATMTAAHAFDESKYPSWRGLWQQSGNDPKSAWDPSKTLAQGVTQAPLTEEYRKIFLERVKEEEDGGLAADPTTRCVPGGMPRVMMAVMPMELVITPNATYFLIQQYSTQRRIHTDGRTFPEHFEEAYAGYSIGEWKDTDGDGKYDTLLVETRGIAGPRAFDSSGLPFHEDGESVIKERIYGDKNNPDVLYDEITTTDNALTKPWTVTRSYKRVGKEALLDWSEYLCQLDPTKIHIRDSTYKISPDGFLMPIRKGQAPPDMRYFQPKKTD